MNVLSVESEALLRLGFFFVVFALMALWELASPRRGLSTSKKSRWFTNVSITVINSLVVRLIVPITASAVAVIAEERGVGLLNSIEINAITAGIAAIVVLDLTIYLQHVLFHHLAHLWRLHMVHHTDMDIDVTTGARFHPIEIALSMVIKLTIVAALGAPAWSVVAFEVLLNATSMFNHSNVYIPGKIDGLLRKFVVTPDMHRVHHSVVVRETNSNFGFNLPWWDYLFGTYRAQPEAGHIDMTIGLKEFRDPARLNLSRILALPITYTAKRP